MRRCCKIGHWVPKPLRRCTLPRSSVCVVENANLLEAETGLLKIRTAVSKIRESSEGHDYPKSYSCSTSELDKRLFLLMCSLPSIYITVNLVSSPIPKLETYCYQSDIEEMFVTYLLKTSLLVIMSALRNEAAPPDPMHAVITGTRDGRCTLSKRADVA